MKKAAIVLLSLSLLLTGCGGGSAEETPETLSTPASEAVTLPTEVTETTAPEPTETTEPQPESFILSFAGDCTLGSDPSLAGSELGFLKTIGDDYDYPFRNVKTYFENDELTLVNLEGPLTDSGYPVQKRYRFFGPESYVNILTGSSIEAVSLANNHSLDYGKTGLENTRRVLSEAGVSYVERDNTALIRTEHGLTVGLYGAVYYYIDREALEEAVASLREQADIVIFVPHWGSGLAPHPGKEQVELAHAAIDAGADLVCGSHPHVLEDMEYYGDGVIFYSMGNFCFGGNAAPDDMDTAIWQQEVLRYPDGTVTLGRTSVIPASISSVEAYNNFQPTPYAEGSPEYQRVLDKLQWKDPA